MRRDTFLALGVVILILAALAAKSMFLSVPPVAHAPGQFDAERAKARLAYILGDQSPHPADSTANDAVRARLLTTLEQMKLRPVVRDQMACNDFQKARLIACTRVRNVVAMLGPPTGKALLLSAHYDSVPVGPGASDDGIGVATLLEVGSILKDRPLKRPVLLLFNEGEELGLIGARAFLADPLSRSVDSLLNFEARGVNGPATMFETNQPNGAAMSAYQTNVHRPFASSLSTDVARLIPNDTDVTTFKERGWLTLNTAIVGNETRYHSPGDDLAGLDVRSLQSMGDSGLALASSLAIGTPEPQGDRIFMDLAQRVLVDVPLVVGIAWLLFLLLAFAVQASREGAPIRGPAIALLAIISGVALAWTGVTLMSAVRAGTYWRAHPQLAFMAIYATILAAELMVLRALGGRLGTRALSTACWLVFLLIGGLLALVAPGGIIYFLLPPSLILLGRLMRHWYRPAEAIGTGIGLLLLYVSWGELLAAVEQMFSPGPLWVVAPAAAIMIIPAIAEASALFRRADGRILIGGSLGLALLGWAAVGAAPAYSQDHQQRFTIEHLTEFPAGNSSWSILSDGAPLPEAYAGLGQWRRAKLPFSERERWLAAAPAVAGLQAPAVQLLSSVSRGDARSLTLRLQADGADRIVMIAPASARIRSAGMPGFVRPIAGRGDQGKVTISCTGRSCDGATLLVDQGGTGTIDFTVIGSRNGLPPSAAPLVRARPSLARPQYVPDETVTVSHVRI